MHKTRRIAWLEVLMNVNACTVRPKENTEAEWEGVGDSRGASANRREIFVASEC
jgi:hypothetical protein